MNKKKLKKSAKAEMSKALPIILKLLEDPDFVKQVNEKGYQVDIAEILKALVEVSGFKPETPALISLAEAANKIGDQVEDVWMGSKNDDCIGFTVLEARKLSENKIFNLASWLKYSFGPCLKGETDADWIESAKVIEKILAEKKS